MFKEEVKVLDAGIVKLVDKMGDDYSIIRAARVSTGTAERIDEKKDSGLISYLYRNKHLSPIEAVTLTFYVKAPLFVVSQIVRHRTFSFNIASQRYKEFIPECYTPEDYRVQDTKNKQNSFEDENFNKENKKDFDELLGEFYNIYEGMYKSFNEDGMAREQARIITPSAQYTELYFTADLRNLLHFIELRNHPHAQKEIRVYAQAILEILMKDESLKWTMKVFNEMNELENLMSKAVNMDRIKLKQYLLNFTEDATNKTVK